MKKLLLFTLALLIALSFVACDAVGGDETPDSSDGSGSVPAETTGGTSAESTWKNYSAVSVISGEYEIRPFSGALSSYTERVEDGEVVCAQGCGDGAYNILRAPIDTFPTLTRNGTVTVSLPSNGILTSVCLVDMADPDRKYTKTTLEALSQLPVGEYCVVLWVNIKTENDALKEWTETSYEDVFRLVVNADS